MIVSRAVFLRVCGTALAGGALPRWALPRDNPATTSGAARFRPHIGSVFTIADAGEHTGQRFHLREVAETMISPGIEQYALNFSGSAETPLPHGLYTFRHVSLGAIDMFISPVGAPGGAPNYQACFSRIARAET